MGACIIRAIWTDAPPAPAATTISTGLFGSQATAGGVASTIVRAAPAPRQIGLIIVSSLNSTHARPKARRCASCLLAGHFAALRPWFKGVGSRGAGRDPSPLALVAHDFAPGPVPDASRSNVARKVS